MAAIFVILISISVIIVVKVIQRLIIRRKFHAIIDEIPGPKAYPIIGNLLDIIHITRDDRLKWLIQLSKQYERGIFRLWIAGAPNIQLTKAKHLESILPDVNLITKSRIYRFLNSWLGDGLLTSTGHQWHRQRKLITPTFHFTILEVFGSVMSDKAEILNNCIGMELEKNPGKPVDVFELLTKCALDIICESAMGININAQTEFSAESSVASHTIAALVLERIVQPWLHWDWLYYRTAKGKQFQKLVNLNKQLTDQVIQEKKVARRDQEEVGEDFSTQDKTKDRKRKAFLDHLMDASQRDKEVLSDEEMREEVVTFMFAGHDTTAAAMSWALFFIGNNSYVQEKIHEEQTSVFGDSMEPATVKELSNLKYLHRVIKETLRMCPSVPTVSRSATQDVTIDGYTVPKGSIITMHINLVHRDPEHWADPDKFDPDRFLPENSRGRHSYAYLPFSAGPRNCIGQKFAVLELKTVLTAFLRKWRVKSLQKPEEIIYLSEFVLRSRDGIKMHITRK